MVKANENSVVIHFTASLQKDNNKRPYLVLRKHFFTVSDLDFLLNTLASKRKLIAEIAFKDPLRAAGKILAAKREIEAMQKTKYKFF